MAKSYEKKTNQNQKILYLPVGSDNKESAWVEAQLKCYYYLNKPCMKS